MNAFELLCKWPGWDKADAEEIFNSPAWAVPARWGDGKCIIRHADANFRDILGIHVTFDEIENFIGICDRESFPDLHVLWNVKNNLPDALKLALIEKECGPLLQIIENASGKQLSVTGVAPTEQRMGTSGFEITDTDGNIIATFALKVTNAIIKNFGQLKYIDPNHESIRSMTRSARPSYASFNLTENELASLAPGDYIMLPELDSRHVSWETEEPSDGRIRVCSENMFEITFAQIADDNMPDIPIPETPVLRKNGKNIARGRITTLSVQPALTIEEIL